MRTKLAVIVLLGLIITIAICDSGHPALGTNSRATTDPYDPQYDGQPGTPLLGGQLQDPDQRITFLFSSAVLPDGGTFDPISLNGRCSAPLSKGGNPCVRS